jgi:YHS domain-containing protein
VSPAPAARPDAALARSGDPPATSPAPPGTAAGGEQESPAGRLPPAPGGPPVLATDLVCGMAVVADEESLHLDHDGERYWFCGSGCLRAFAADPAAYLPTPAG